MEKEDRQMTYWTGQNLERRVAQFGLSDLYKLLTEVGSGKQNWPGSLSITPQKPEVAEQLRITIYSMLHETGLKPHFRVRMAFGSLVLEQKTAASAVSIAPVNQPAGHRLPYNPDREPVLGDEGLADKIWEVD
jgi:hypothetical protein